MAYEKQIRQSVLKEKTKLYQVYLQPNNYQKIKENDKILKPDLQR